MSMTRKDFEDIARCMAQARRETVYSLDALDDANERLATVLAASNPRFDRERFLAACKAP